jgi:hypothetical protein
MSPPTFVGRHIVFVLSVTQFVSATPLKLLNRISWNCLQITSTKFRGSTFPGNMHNYIWCPYYLPIFMKFCSVVSEELHWQATSVVNFQNFLSSKGHNSHKIRDDGVCLYIRSWGARWLCFAPLWWGDIFFLSCPSVRHTVCQCNSWNYWTEFHETW